MSSTYSLSLSGWPPRTEASSSTTMPRFEHGAGSKGDSVNGKLRTGRSFSLSAIAASALLAFGIVLSVAAYRFTERQIAQDARSKFENESVQIQQALERRLASYAHLLLGLRGLYRATDAINRGEFRDYVVSLELPLRYPAVTAMNFAQYVTEESKASFEKTIRNDTSVDPNGFSAFHIAPPGKRADYHVLVYLEPFEKNLHRFGLDIQGVRSPGAGALLSERRDTAELMSSGMLVPGENDRQLALRGAAYRRGLPIETVEQRRHAFVGTVGMAFSLTALAREVVHPSALKAVHFRIHNLGQSNSLKQIVAPSDENLLIDSNMLPGHREPPASSGELLTRVAQVDFGGRILGIHFDGQRDSFSTPLDRALPVVTLSAGVFISLLLYAVMRSLQRSRSELEEAVQERTHALREINLNLQTEIAERSRLEREVLLAGQEQRRKIGQELHDDLGQRLTAVAFLAESLARDLAQEESAAATGAFKIEKLLSDAVSQIRLLARGLFPVALPGGLAGALEQLSASARETYGIRCRLVCDAAVSVENTGVLAFHLFRMCQEAVNNAVKHGKASCVTIELASDGVNPRMTITDDGVGFDEDNALRHPGLGLQIMRYRCKIVGLGFAITRGPDGGTVVSIGGAPAGRSISP
jgi:signal transduction histidine kinase